MERVLGYARVSLESENIDNQRLSIGEFAKQNGYDLLTIFEDVGVSGSKPAFEREGFRKMIETADALGVRTIVVYDLTRLGRDLFDLINTYKTLLERGYNIVFVKHPELNAKPDSPIAEALRKALLTILGVVAELERAFIIERTRVGLERARAQGKHIGRNPVEIPIEKVKEYRKMGLSKKAIYTLLVQIGYLKHKEKGKERVLTYDRFVKRLKELGI